MAKRKKVRKTKSSKTRKVKRATRKTARRRKAPAKSAKRSKASSLKANAKNRQALWGTYKDLQKKVDKAWAKIRSDVKREAKPETIIRDRNQLLLLLGECNYMARECMRHARANTRR